MIRKMKPILIALVVALLVVIPVAAVTDGDPDLDGHPYVGLMVALDEDGNPLWRCSGTLMSSTVFMTAGHCTEAPAVSAAIWFDDGHPDPISLSSDFDEEENSCDGVAGYPCTGDASGSTYTHPEYNPAAFFLYDLGVVKLDNPFESPNGIYGELPELDQLDSLKPRRQTGFTAVGYGLQKSFPTAAEWKDVADRTRMVAHPHLLQINTPGFTGDFSLLLSNNANTGGTCFGDSGGPNFLGGDDSNLVAGVTSFGLNGTCGGTGGVYRIDRADDLNWLAEFGISP